MWPNIMVALVFMPRLCATRITVSHSSPVHLPRPILRRTVGAKISPPPPGTLSRPALCRRSITKRSFASSVSPGGLKKRTNSMNSGGLNACACTCGKRCLMAPSSSSYQPSGRSGCMPPCIRICVPPMSTSSWIFCSTFSTGST